MINDIYIGEPPDWREPLPERCVSDCLEEAEEKFYRAMENPENENDWRLVRALTEELEQDIDVYVVRLFQMDAACAAPEEWMREARDLLRTADVKARKLIEAEAERLTHNETD